MQGGFSEFLLIVLAVALVAAALGDLRHRTISNKLNGAIALLAIPFWWAMGLSLWPEIAIQVAIALGVLLIFWIAFAYGAMGGGDVKMIAALSLWLPFGAVVKLIMLMSVAGGLLTVAMVLRHRARKAPGQPEIPYGVAIAFGGFWLISERLFNQFA